MIDRIVRLVRTLCGILVAYGLTAFVLCVLSGVHDGTNAALWTWSLPCLAVAAIDQFFPRASKGAGRKGADGPRDPERS